MAGADLTNLQTYRTPKERMRSAFWTLLSVFVSCALSWDLSVYSIKFWESGRASGLIVPGLLAIALVWTLRLSVRVRLHWWPIVPAIIAVIAPIALHLELPSGKSSTGSDQRMTLIFLNKVVI